MNRRGFLKSVVVGIAGATVPLGALTVPLKAEAVEVAQFTGYDLDAILDFVARRIIEDIERDFAEWMRKFAIGEGI